VPEPLPVLIVGGGITGLSAALFLAAQDVPCLLVERHQNVARFPRFRSVNTRTMELYRTVDRALERELLAAGDPEGEAGEIGKGPSLASPDTVWNDAIGESMPRELSPARNCVCDQDRVEPIVRRHAQRLGAEIRFGAELVRMEQDADGVTAVILDRASGDEATVRARYLIAADGASSPLREQLGIASHGPGHFAHRMAISFHADLSAATKDRKVFACWVVSLGGYLVRRDADKGLWQLSAPYAPENGERAEDFTTERCLDLIREAAGLPDVDATIAGVLPWEVAARVADRYREGRVFLVGDAAHVNGPWGGFGANTGIQDAHNLAWKLAAVTKGTAGEALLDTYDTERRAVGDLTVGHAVKLMKVDLDPAAAQHLSRGWAEVAVGYSYLPGTPTENPLAPSGRPGFRAPHVTLADDVSTIDLVGRGWVLLAGHESGGAEEAERAAASLGIKLTTHRIDSRAWERAYGVSSSGASLIRPDGFVAWRAETEPDWKAFRRALTQTCARERPYVAINVLTAKPERQQDLLREMAETITADVTAEDHPGVLSSRLYRDVDGQRVVNVTEWPSEEAFRAAHARLEFPAALARIAGLVDAGDHGNYELAWELP
jgi:putative polyketide hydroxylase